MTPMIATMVLNALLCAPVPHEPVRFQADLEDTPAVVAARTPVKRHCQIPCGIYGDKIRIDLMIEDAATIAKGMKQIGQLGKGSPVNYNQIVRWVQNKDQHATAIQDQVAAYWLTQRIKAPKTDDAAAKARYLKQLEVMHGLTVAAMKCKQTTDAQWPAKVKSLALEFAKTYFSKHDLEHIEKHHKGHDHK